MSLEIGRQGYMGLALESVPGTPESSPSVFIPFTENSLQEKHEPLVDIASRAGRQKDFNAVDGKKWSEGDMAAYVDCNNIGYLLKIALGRETKTQLNASPPVHDHEFSLTASGNTPTSATLFNYRGAGPSVKRFPYMCIDVLELEISNEDIGIATASFIGGFPEKVSAPALTTTSGTLLTWKDMTVQFGDTVADALVATPTKVTNLKIEIANNVETHYRSGSDRPDAITVGEAEVTGEFTVFLENDVELDAYRNLTKRAMVVTLNGASLGSGYSERVLIKAHRMFIEDHEPETDLDGVFAITQSFRIIQGTPLNPGWFDVTVRNGKSATY